MESITVHLLYKGAAIDVVVDASTASFADIRASLSHTHPQLVAVRLVFQGKQWPDETLLKDAGVRDGARVMVVASTTAELTAFQTVPKPRVRDDLTHTHTSPHGQVRGVASARATRVTRPRDYGFGEIRVLEGFGDKETARSILESIATDPGVLAVMRSRRWWVPVLGEMYPDGKVGVDPVCVLGWNKNMGQEISLRIRTDDLLGFRKPHMIRKVVWHELAHNIRSEHDGRFYDLCSQLEREGDAADWRRGTARRVGGDRTYERFREDMALPLPRAYEDIPEPSYVGGHGVVGGETPSLLASGAAGSARAEALAAAARARLSATASTSGTPAPPGASDALGPQTAPVSPHPHHHTPDLGCCPASRPDTVGVLEEHGTAVPADSGSEEEEMPDERPAEAGPRDDENTATSVLSNGDSATEQPAASAERVVPAPTQASPHVSADVPAPRSEPQEFDLPPDVAAAVEAAAARRSALVRYLEKLRIDCTSQGGDFPRAVALLLSIVRRAADALSAPSASDAKYLSVNATSNTFQQRTCGSSAALQLLIAAGFRREADWLRVPPAAADVAALWLARGVLNDYVVS